ncbi:hypothetical protein BASA81_005162 [Batrachochytrium salamandrivorans]|nr:hypothetical protein BASA81_005162 [Batrachochytrium salamandrivorans]
MLLMVMEGSVAATRTAAALHSALNLLTTSASTSTLDQQVLFLRPKSSLATNGANCFEFLPESSSLAFVTPHPESLLERIGIKYLDVDDIFPILLNLHLLPELKCVVVDDLDSLVSTWAKKKLCVALTLSLPKVDRVIVTLESSSSTSSRPLLPAFANRVVFKL